MDLSERMKRYESVNNIKLIDRLPVIIRIDGQHFHTYTRGLSKNDENLSNAMDKVGLELCKNISGIKLAYLQSDEISLLINPWNDFNSTPWFDNKVQKLTSVSASIAGSIMTLESKEIFGVYKPAFFDSRAFVLPLEEVTNYFIWRQQDTTRNSIQVLGQIHFSHKQLHKKSCDNIQEMLYKEKGINWNDEPIRFKRGRCIVKKDVAIQTNNTLCKRPKWVIDNEIPVFTQQRNYIEERIR